MNRNAAATHLTEIMSDEFDIDDRSYSDSFPAAAVGRNYIKHARFVVTVEKEFGLRFTGSGRDGFKNVEAMLDLFVQRAIDSRLSPSPRAMIERFNARQRRKASGNPPSTGIRCPDVQRDFSPARNRIASAQSAGSIG